MTATLTALLALSGSLFILIAALGLLRLPDALCRCHAVAKALTLGILLILMAAWIETGTEKVGMKILLAILFQLATIPVAGHLIGLVAYKKNLPRWQERPTAEIEKN